MLLTIKIKLLATNEQKASLLKTMQVFNDACNYASIIAFNEKRFNYYDLHHRIYSSFNHRKLCKKVFRTPGTIHS